MLARVWSPQLENERDIDVFLPPSYAADAAAVSRDLHAGRPEPGRPGARVRRHLGPAAARSTISPARGLETIVVGVPNSGAERLREYSPFPDERHGGGGGDAYLAFSNGR